MITVLVSWTADEDLSREELIARFKGSIPVYQGREHLLRKYICFEEEGRKGKGIYLWDDRAAAEAFYAMAVPIIEKETGHKPSIQYLDTPIVVDKQAGTVEVFD